MKQYDKAIDSLRTSVAKRNNLWYNRLYLVSAYANAMEDAGEALKDFKRTFPLFTRDTLDRCENDILNPNLNFDEFHTGLDKAGFKRQAPRL